MREIYRVLKTGGWAILQVPILGEQTFEDPDATTPEAREHRYGFAEHVRGYGKDYKDFLAQSGFSVKVDDFVNRLEQKTIEFLGLPDHEDIYFCKKYDPRYSGI
jgi:ubiquinone/menaquinone biosynthesis C-methylase UbiE